MSLAGGVLTVTDPVGRANDIGVIPSTGIVRIVDSAGPLTAPLTCTQVSKSQVTCPRATVSSVVVNLGGGDDTVHALGDIPTTLSGGDGADQITGGNALDTLDGGNGDDAFSNISGGRPTRFRCGAGTDRFDIPKGPGRPGGLRAASTGERQAQPGQPGVRGAPTVIGESVTVTRTTIAGANVFQQLCGARRTRVHPADERHRALRRRGGLRVCERLRRGRLP